MLRRLIAVTITALALTLGAYAQPASAAQKAADRAASGAKSTAASAKTATGLLDINSASKEQLDALPGIGKVYSQKIIDGRPYDKKDQLVSKKVLPQGVYNKIKDKIIAKQK
jgi:DNA uptake protein ComE-like DNA-binding protein